MNENVTVCITPKGEKPVLHFSQFDNERVFTVTVLADDGESAAVLTGLDIEFRLRKTDSHVVTIAPESVADNVITFKTTEQMCACCGQNIASVVLMKDDMNVSTLDILVDIQRDILSGGLTSESDIRNLTSQIEQIVPEVVGDDYYNKQEVDDLLAEHTFDPSNYYNKSDVDGLLADKADADDVYNKSETDNLLSAKMDNIGYHGIVDDAAVISFTTDCNAPLDIIKGNINPVQSGTGTPSPDNVRPISGFSALTVARTGKNRLNYDAWKTVSISKGTAVWENNGVKITATDNDAYTNFTNTTFPIAARVPITEGETITLSWQETTNTSGTVVIFPNGKTSGMVVVNNATVKKATYTAMSGITFVSFRFGVANSGDTIAYKNIQIEKGSTATDFEPYNGQTATVNFGQTVYGGVADVTNGKVTVTHKLVTYNGSENWQFLNPSFYIASPNDCRVSQTPIANEYNGVAPTYYNMMINGNIALSTALDNLLVRNDSIASVADFKTALSNNPLTVLYELATPIEITTTPETVSSIAGDNNIFIDTGNMTEIAYFENAEDNLIKLIKACQI